jgi:hypothetical protein
MQAKSDPTIITLTLPTDSSQGAMLIQRGTLAQLRPFTYLDMENVAEALTTALHDLEALSANPPVITETPPPIAPKPAQPAKPSEPMLSVTVGKKTVDIPARYLQVAHADQQPQALLIAGKLLESKLWDGSSPIFIADAIKTLKQIQHLDAKTLTLFTLTDFVQPGTDEPVTKTNAEATEDDTPDELKVGQTVRLSTDAVDTDGEAVPFDVGRVVEVDTSEDPPRVWLESDDGEQDVWVSLEQLQTE